jgi:predicted nucleic acid-binding protein
LISVVDSSVAVKWYAAEQDSFLARALFGRPLVAPDLIRVEVANTLWKKVRLGQLTLDQSASALGHLARSVTLFRSEPFAESALELSLDLVRPVYDCFFLIIARTLDFPLVTSDKRLWAATRGTPFNDRVIMLRDWEQNHV